MLSLLNPKGYAAMAALISGFVLVPDHVALDAATKAVVLVGLVLVIDVGWLFAGAALTPLLFEARLIDALYAMGRDPITFLVVPRVVGGA